jgi:hypothetical protein
LIKGTRAWVGVASAADGPPPKASIAPGRCRAPLPHHVYVLRCSDDTLYTGYTTDVERRAATCTC